MLFAAEFMPAAISTRIRDPWFRRKTRDGGRGPRVGDAKRRKVGGTGKKCGVRVNDTFYGGQTSVDDERPESRRGARGGGRGAEKGKDGLWIMIFRRGTLSRGIFKFFVAFQVDAWSCSKRNRILEMPAESWRFGRSSDRRRSWRWFLAIAVPGESLNTLFIHQNSSHLFLWISFSICRWQIMKFVE